MIYDLLFYFELGLFHVLDWSAYDHLLFIIALTIPFSFKEFKKADAQSIEENNGLLWAKKIFKTKPNRTISDEFRNNVNTIFHHLTKEELIDKVLANYLAQTSAANSKIEASKKK